MEETQKNTPKPVQDSKPAPAPAKPLDNIKPYKLEVIESSREPIWKTVWSMIKDG